MKSAPASSTLDHEQHVDEQFGVGAAATDYTWRDGARLLPMHRFDVGGTDVDEHKTSVAKRKGSVYV